MVKKCCIKNGTKVTFNLSSNVSGDTKDETNFTNKSSWNNRQVMRLWGAFINGLTTNIKAMTLIYSWLNVILLFEVYKTYKTIQKKKKPMLVSKYAACSSKTSSLIKELQASGLSIHLVIKTGLDKIHILGSLLF